MHTYVLKITFSKLLSFRPSQKFGSPKRPVGPPKGRENIEVNPKKHGPDFAIRMADIRRMKRPAFNHIIRENNSIY